MSATPLLNIAGLTASVDEKTILHGIDLTVAAGETHVLMGPNGAGKSTMGHVIMGDPVYTVNQGTITFDAPTSPTSPPTSAPARACSSPSRHPSRFPACRCPASCARKSPAAPAWR